MESRKITLSAINAEDKRYQVRDPRTATHGEKINQERTSKDHIKGIIKTLSDNKRARLAPIEVIEDPNNRDQYIIVDGFHRYAAYSKIKERTKGGRYKQITVKVYTEGVPLERALTINTEHNALQLTNSQRDELKWQQFLNLMQQDKEPTPVTVAEKRARIAAKLLEAKDSNLSSEGSHGELSDENIVEGQIEGNLQLITSKRPLKNNFLR